MISAENSQQIFAPQQEAPRRQPGMSPLLWLIAGVFIPAIITFGLAITDETQVVALVIAVIGALVILTEPFWGLVFVIGLVFVRPEDTFPILATMRLTLAVSVLTLISMWFRYFLARTEVIRHPVIGMILGFAAWVAISTFGRGYLVDAIEDSAKLVILLILTINLVRTPQRFRAFGTIIILLTAYVSLYSIYLYYTGGALARTDGIEALQAQATGTFGDPNDLSAVIVAGLGMLLPRLREKGVWRRILIASVALLFLMATFYTNSRGGLVALVVVAGAFSISFMKNKVAGAVLGAVAMATLLAVAPARMTNFDSSDASANSRFQYWDEGFTQLKANPLTGVGYGLFPDYNAGMTAHNSFVLCFSELGLPGFFFWMGCIYFGFRRPRAAALEAETELQSQNKFAARLCLGGFLAAAFWISRTYIPVLYIYLGLPVAQQIADSGRFHLRLGSFKDTAREYAGVGAFCTATLVVIWLMVWKFK
jgi:O-antigen ligase